ncbi:tripartite tricarboxylate transporter TctB family protein [Oricola sp.]|uniref:tripartite tricarboxylate transporter TctB family protein n=1 Tax=Oricola sp. TaxID=1979950 RepID=UPI0025CFA16C|nr:tripartite tricarboxylate transporter TctB family protein [Oricola sp.]MCI5074090.1 tripartite tricarboxylate transporter TctB family protein [Oricola sp.]
MFVFIASTLIAALALWQALLLPPAIFEPLGPSTFPICLAIALFALGLLDLLAWVRRCRSAAPAEEQAMAATEVDMPAQPGNGRLWVPVLIGAATFVYVAVWQHFRVGFPILTAVYVFAASAAFAGKKPVELCLMAIGAILFGYANYYLFTEVLFIDI